MDKKKQAKELEKRTREFAVRIIKLSTKLPSTPEGNVIKTQITKAGTSVGANYREANRARSRADFSAKIDIVVKEASETQFWIEVIVESGMMSWKKVKEDYQESSELLAIFTSISNSLKKENH